MPLPFRWRTQEGTVASRVTTLELFFDLVFVFTLTQLTRLLEHDLSLASVGRVLLAFGVLWWMYGGYAWLTNQVPPTGPVERVLLLGGMAGFLLTAVSIPHAFDATGIAFGAGYLVVVLIHLAMLSQSSSRRGVARLAPFNLTTAGMVLAAGFVDGPAVYALWAAALTLQVITPYLGVAPQFDLNAEHFVERHGLLVIVALGESVIAIGASVDAEHLDAATSGAVVLALALPAALWWSYFSGDTDAETALASAEPAARALLAIRAYFYAHIPMLLGVMFAAAGLHAAVAHPTDRLSASSALVLFGGLSLFCVGNAEFRRVLAIGSAGRRVVMGLVVAAAVPLAWLVPAWLHMAIAAGLLVGLLAARPSTGRDPSGRVHTERPPSLR